MAHTLLNGIEYTVKVLEIHNHRRFENLLTGNLGICALHTLTSDHRCLGEKLGGIFNGLGDPQTWRAVGEFVGGGSLVHPGRIPDDQHKGNVGIALDGLQADTVWVVLPFVAGTADRAFLFCHKSLT